MMNIHRNHIFISAQSSFIQNNIDSKLHRNIYTYDIVDDFVMHNHLKRTFGSIV